jgi:hypothetical protein
MFRVQGQIMSKGDFHVSRIPETSKRLTIVAPAKQGSDFVMVAEERDKKLTTSVLKDESKIAIAAAFEQFVPQFADAETAVQVGLAVAFGEIAKRQKAFDSFALGKLA